MKKFFILFLTLLILSGCSSEPEKQKPSFSFTMATSLKDQSYISFKATISTGTEKKRDALEKRVERLKQALTMKLRVLIAKQVKDEKKMEKLIKIIVEGRKGKDIDVVVSEFVLKKR